MVTERRFSAPTMLHHTGLRCLQEAVIGHRLLTGFTSSRIDSNHALQRQRFCVGQFDEADWNRGQFGQLCRPKPPRAGDNFKRMRGGWSHDQGHQDALCPDALSEFLQFAFVKTPPGLVGDSCS